MFVGVACYVLAFGTQCCLNCVKKVMFCCCLFLDMYIGVGMHSLSLIDEVAMCRNYIHAETRQYDKLAKGMSRVAQTSDGCTNFFSILSLSSIPTPYHSARRHAGRHLLQDGGLRTYIFLG